MLLPILEDYGDRQFAAYALRMSAVRLKLCTKKHLVAAFVAAFKDGCLQNWTAPAEQAAERGRDPEASEAQRICYGDLSRPLPIQVDEEP